MATLTKPSKELLNQIYFDIEKTCRQQFAEMQDDDSDVDLLHDEIDALTGQILDDFASKNEGIDIDYIIELFQWYDDGRFGIIGSDYEISEDSSTLDVAD